VWRLYDRRGFACRAVWQSLLALQRRVSGYFEVNATTAGFAYLLGILLIAAAWGRIESLVSSVTGIVCFSDSFLPPIGRPTISDPENRVALFTFLATALVARNPSDRARKQTLEARHRQQETERLYELSRTILLTGTAGPVGFHVVQNLARIFDCRSARGCMRAGRPALSESRATQRKPRLTAQNDIRNGNALCSAEQRFQLPLRCRSLADFRGPIRMQITFIRVANHTHRVRVN